jgi:hypothetical protein
MPDPNKSQPQAIKCNKMATEHKEHNNTPSLPKFKRLSEAGNAKSRKTSVWL